MGSKRSVIFFLTFVALGSHVYSLPLENEQPVAVPETEEAPQADALSVVEGSDKNATEKLWPFFPFPASITALFPTPPPSVIIGQPAPPAPIIFINPPPAPTPPPTTTTTTTTTVAPPAPPPPPAPPANRTSESEVEAEVIAPVVVESESSANEENKDEKLLFPLLTFNAALPPFPALPFLRPPSPAPVVSVPPPAPYLIFPPGSASGTDITVVNPPNNNPIVVTQGTGAVVASGSSPTATVVQPVPVVVNGSAGGPTAIFVPQSILVPSNQSPSTVVANVGPLNTLATSNPSNSQNSILTSQTSFVVSIPSTGLLGPFGGK